jgi:oxygen-independent coproporphyrinogen-3 oxidase
VLRWITDAFDIRRLSEFTVEAGRPETVSKAKIEAMVASGVNRISINPQTMQTATLRGIGRNHSIADIYNAVDLVKATNLILNMDLILGLPNETGTMFLDSLQKVIAIDPENITVHTLAPKRAASWHKEFDELNLLQSQELVNAHGIAVDLLQQHGFIPYYLYRQRAILGDLENIGYAKRGTESVYNIQMMEERQTILGLGGGAVTKWVVGPDFKVSRHQNPKCPATYYQRVSEDIVKKAQLTRILLS